MNYFRKVCSKFTLLHSHYVQQTVNKKEAQKLIFHICAERPLVEGLQSNFTHSEISLTLSIVQNVTSIGEEV
jgi:hypothetical protein